jgi:hypothetical protein
MKTASRWFSATTACALLVLAFAPSACEGNTLATPQPAATPDPGGTSSGEVDPDAGTPVATDDAATGGFDDGVPTRLACTSALGSGLSPDHGRLDGILVSIVGEKERGCPTDPTHLHLQVKMNGGIYDIAVNLDGFEGETDAKLPGIPFSEGWHPMDLDYVRDFGLHSTDLTLTSITAIRARVVGELTNANRISVFGTGYPGSDGAHIVHRSSRERDGALVINPLAPKARVIAFRFADHTF